MITTEKLFIYRSERELEVQGLAIPWAELEDSSKQLFFDAQADVEAAGFDLDNLEETEEFLEFEQAMLAADDQGELLDQLNPVIDFFVSGEAVVGYLIADLEQPDITYAASFLPLPELTPLLCGQHAGPLPGLELLRRRR